MLFAGDAKDAFAIIVAIIALVGVIISASISLFVSRRSNYLNAVTAERSKWIDKLRVNVSNLIAQAHVLDVELYRSDEFSGSKDYDAAVKELVSTMTFVRLQLNPNGKIDANIILLLGAIQNHVGEQDYHNLESLFVRHMQFLLKEEWEQVKYEARGWLGRLSSIYKRRRHDAAYSKFCKEKEGAVTPWL